MAVELPGGGAAGWSEVPENDAQAMLYCRCAHLAVVVTQHSGRLKMVVRPGVTVDRLSPGAIEIRCSARCRRKFRLKLARLRPLLGVYATISYLPELVGER